MHCWKYPTISTPQHLSFVDNIHGGGTPINIGVFFIFTPGGGEANIPPESPETKKSSAFEANDFFSLILPANYFLSSENE